MSWLKVIGAVMQVIALFLREYRKAETEERRREIRKNPEKAFADKFSANADGVRSVERADRDSQRQQAAELRNLDEANAKPNVPARGRRSVRKGRPS